jgi:hypothetical protein
MSASYKKSLRKSFINSKLDSDTLVEASKINMRSSFAEQPTATVTARINVLKKQISVVVVMSQREEKTVSSRPLSSVNSLTSNLFSYAGGVAMASIS